MGFVYMEMPEINMMLFILVSLFFTLVLLLLAHIKYVALTLNHIIIGKIAPTFYQHVVYEVESEKYGNV